MQKIMIKGCSRLTILRWRYAKNAKKKLKFLRNYYVIQAENIFFLEFIFMS